MALLTLASVAVSAVGIGCGAGPYGYAREYAPTRDERRLLETSTEVTYEELKRDPADFASVTVGWFGVVQDFEAGPEGRVTLRLTFTTLAQRNLCDNERASSCRVTVSHREGGPFSAIVTLSEEERSGEDRLQRGSLVRVFGSANGDFDERGGPVLDGEWHRHWPRSTYRTTAARGRMRR
ncbi:MAG: hypothetical protein AAGH15_28145 [Myxococcota bacterium]